MPGRYLIEGLVRAQDDLTGIPDLVVVALDIDQASAGIQTPKAAPRRADLDRVLTYDRLGSVLTDANGRFRLEFDEADFRVNANELRPDIMLAVLAPEIARESKGKADAANALPKGRSVIHVSPILRLKAGKTESYSIRVPRKAIHTHSLLAAGEPTTDPNLVRHKLSERVQNTRQLLSTKLGVFQARLAAQTELLQAGDKLFAGFSLSTVKESVKSRDTFLRPGEDLSAKQSRVIASGVSRWSETQDRRTMALQLSSALARELDLLGPGGEVRGSVDVRRIWDWWNRRADTTLERRRTAYDRCSRIFREGDLSPTPSPSVDPPSEAPATPTSDFTVDALVERQVALATVPEEPLVYAKVIDPQYRSRELRNTINGLELVSGPTDVTSYYDFHSIQIAFESIWTEVFDESIEKLGREIFAEVVQVQDETCADALIRASRLTVTDPASLKSLLLEYRRITGNRASTRLDRLFTDLEKRLAEPYKFDVFAANSVNYGVAYTFRQKWEPGSYQVGKLVSTVPLAPKEERKYETKVTRKLSKAEKVIDEREFKGSSEATTTSRAESEIVNRATNKTSFSTNASGQVNLEMYQAQVGMTSGMESEKFSSSTKKNFREAVLKSAQEYRKQTKLEVSTSSEDTTETSNSGTLSNPNDEIAVTYLFYELQRQYRISEQLHRITPTILVAFEVPKPHEIDNDWLMTHAWIIRRALLDESFHSALDLVTTSVAGDEIALQELGLTLQRHQKLVDELTRQLEIKNQATEQIMERIIGLMTGNAVLTTANEIGNFVNGLLNPLAGLTGGGDTGPDLEKFKEILELQLERSEKEQQRLEGRLKEAMSDLQAVTTQFGQATQTHFNQQTALAQLRIHVKENLLYYMQAIWDYEPPDQRYFRLYDLEIDWFEAPSADIPLGATTPRRNPATGEIEWVTTGVSLPLGGVVRSRRKLVDVADLDNLLGFKGNYAIFPMKELNYLHLHMMQDYIDTATGGLRDPDTFADVTTQQLIDYLKCVRVNHPDVYEVERDHIIGLINERQQSPRREEELVIVPTDSLYLECLPGKHPLLEDFKLIHRAMDVKKVQAEVRKLELENLRYAGRLLAADRADPDVGKVIRVEGVTGINVET